MYTTNNNNDYIKNNQTVFNCFHEQKYIFFFLCCFSLVFYLSETKSTDLLNYNFFNRSIPRVCVCTENLYIYIESTVLFLDLID